MPSNARSCSTWRLYVIIDRSAAGSRDLADLAAAAIRGGADVLQLRDKAAGAKALTDEARRLLHLTRPAGIPLIINDWPEVAKAAGADGVHLGQDDLSIAKARALLGGTALIGRSTHSLPQALEAEQEGADYLGVGPVFATPTKPDYPQVGVSLVREVASRVRIPFVAIGGIEPGTIGQVIAAGARCVAVVRAVCAAPDPAAAAQQLKKACSTTDKIFRGVSSSPL